MKSGVYWLTRDEKKFNSLNSVENVVKVTRCWSTLKKQWEKSNFIRIKVEARKDLMKYIECGCDFEGVQAAVEGIKRNICEKLKRLRCVCVCVCRGHLIYWIYLQFISRCVDIFLWSVWFHSIKLVRLSLTWEIVFYMNG